MARRTHAPDDPEYGLPELNWPPALIRPAQPPQLVYLDLYVWIGLARAHQGSGTKAYVELLVALRGSVASRLVAVVLTDSLFREISKISDAGRRTALTELIEELSEYTYLTGLADIFQLELQAALDALTSTHGLGFAPTELLGRSILHSMGRVGGLRVMREGVDVTDEVTAKTPGLRERLAEMEQIAEQQLLAGPADADIPVLRAAGYRPEGPQKQVRDNAEYEQHWSSRIAEYRTTHQLRDLVIWRHLDHELLDMITRELMARGLTISQVFNDPASGRRFVMQMPSSAVMVSLIAQYHQDPNKTWKQNDIYDIHALAIAVPYCDIVFTDAAARNALMRRDLDTLMGTVLPRRPEDLTRALEQLGAPIETTRPTS